MIDIEQIDVLCPGDEYSPTVNEPLVPVRDSKPKAKYKVEVLLKSTDKYLYWGSLFIYKYKGNEYNTEPVMFCASEPCTRLFESFEIFPGITCPRCHTLMPEGPKNAIIFSYTPERLAHLVSEIWERLEGNADVYLLRANIGLKTAELSGAPAAKLEKMLDKIRESRDRVLYPKDAIISDTSAGGNLVNRIKAFLTA